MPGAEASAYDEAVRQFMTARIAYLKASIAFNAAKAKLLIQKSQNSDAKASRLRDVVAATKAML